LFQISRNASLFGFSACWISVQSLYGVSYFNSIELFIHVVYTMQNCTIDASMYIEKVKYIFRKCQIVAISCVSFRFTSLSYILSSAINQVKWVFHIWKHNVRHKSSANSFKSYIIKSIVSHCCRFTEVELGFRKFQSSKDSSSCNLISSIILWLCFILYKSVNSCHLNVLYIMWSVIFLYWIIPQTCIIFSNI